MGCQSDQKVVGIRKKFDDKTDDVHGLLKQKVIWPIEPFGIVLDGFFCSEWIGRRLSMS